MSFGAETPFILLARIQVKPDKVQEYLLLAAKTDKAVEDSEPGMIHHTFDQDPADPLCFVWSEVYKNDEAFLAHLANPPVGEYLQGHADLGDNFTVEVYGTVGDKCKTAMEGTGLPLNFSKASLATAGSERFGLSEEVTSRQQTGSILIQGYLGDIGRHKKHIGECIHMTGQIFDRFNDFLS